MVRSSPPFREKKQGSLSLQDRVLNRGKLVAVFNCPGTIAEEKVVNWCERPARFAGVRTSLRRLGVRCRWPIKSRGSSLRSTGAAGYPERRHRGHFRNANHYVRRVGRTQRSGCHSPYRGRRSKLPDVGLSGDAGRCSCFPLIRRSVNHGSPGAAISIVRHLPLPHPPRRLRKPSGTEHSTFRLA